MTPDDKDLLFLLGRMVLRNSGVRVTAVEERQIRQCIRRSEMEEDRVRDEVRTEIAIRFSKQKRTL